MADDLKHRITGAIGEALAKRFTGGKKFDVRHLPEMTLATLATVLPQFLGISDEHREWLEGALQGLVEQITENPDLLDDKDEMKGLFDLHLNKPKGDRGGAGASQLVDGLTAISGMNKDARAAYGVMMGSAGVDADALIDRLMAVQTTSKMFEPAFLMPTPDLQRKTFEKILTKIEADAAKAKAPKPAGKDPIDGLIERAEKLIDVDGMEAELDRQFQEAKAEVIRTFPAATSLDAAAWDALDYEAQVNGETLLKAYRRTHP